MVFFSFILMNSSIVTTYAATGFSTETYTPTIDKDKSVSNYLNLENISYFTVLGNNIYYTLDNVTLQTTLLFVIILMEEVTWEEN